MEPSQAPLANATVIAQMFVERYYKVWSMAPQALYRFYNEESTVSIHSVDDKGIVHTERASGVQGIADKLGNTAVSGAAATAQHLDAQHSASGGILLQVCGSMQKQGVDCRFTQSFFLAPQEKGYFVLNDILRLEPATYAAAAPAADSGVAAPAAVERAPVAAPVVQAPVAVHLYVTAAQPAAPAAVAQPVPQSQAAPQAVPAPALAPAEPAPAPAAAVAAVHDVEVPQPAKQATPPRPVAPPAAANLTYAQRLKLSSPAAPHSSPLPAPAPVQVPAPVAAPAPAEPAADHTALPNGGHVERPHGQPVAGVFCKGLPQDVEVTVEMLEAEFSKFGALLEGKQGITINTPKFGTIKTAQIRYEDQASAEAALRAEVVVAGKRLSLTRLRPDYGPPPRGGPGGRGGPMRFGGGPGRGTGRGDYGGRGGRGGDRGDRFDGPPRERPHRMGGDEGGSSGPESRDRPGSGHGGRGGRGPSDRPGSNSRRGPPGGGRGRGGGGPNSSFPKSSSKDDVPAAAAPVQAAE